jgi:hypothetical protein
MTPTVEELAKRLIEDLAGSRKLNKSSPDNPVKSNVIISKYKELYQWNIQDKSEIRDAISYAVVELKKPIGSNLSGYFYCINSKEIDDYALPHLLSRVQNQYRRIEALKELRDGMRELEANQQSLSFSGIGKILQKELELEKVT